MLSPGDIPNTPGTYAIELQLNSSKTIRIGKLGTFFFPAGKFIYCGSSKGPGGLATRMKRHVFQQNHKRHWHIDYLRAQTSPVYAVLFLNNIASGTKTVLDECQITNLIGALKNSSTPVKGFGSSDCRNGCEAHLLTFPFAENNSVLASSQFSSELNNMISPTPERDDHILKLDLRLIDFDN